MPDSFASHTSSLNSPASSADPITPADGGTLPRSTRALYVGQGGDLRVRMVGGDIVTLGNVQGGAIYPIRIDRVYATGTTAGGLVGLS